MNKSILTLCVAVALMSAAALGADSTWTHVDPNDVWTGEWSDASNWDIGVPGAGDDAYLTNTVGSYAVNMDDVAPNFGILRLSNAGGKPVTLNIHANVGVAESWAYLSAREGSIVNVNGTYQLGVQGGLYGKLVVNNGGYLRLNGRNASGGQDNFSIGSGGAVFIEEGGTLY